MCPPPGVHADADRPPGTDVTAATTADTVAAGGPRVRRLLSLRNTRRCGGTRAQDLDALELLEREHDRLHGDLAGLLCAALADKRPLARRILRRLSAYLLAEEQCLYPALFATMGSETPLSPLIDHQSLKSFVAELLRMEPMEASFAACVSNLQGRLRGYRTRQRRRLFPLMRRTFSRGELELMGGEMQLFLCGNRAVSTGTTVAASALLEALRALAAAPASPPVHGQRN